MNDQTRYTDGYYSVPDGLRLHYRDYPGDAAKPPLLCLPGLTRNARDFAELAERISPRFRVLALEFRGRAGSDYDPVPTRYNPLTYAADVVQLLDQLMIPQAIFVGTSLGGLVTMTVAALAPQRIAATILNDVGPELSDAGLDRIKSYVGKGARFASWVRMAKRNCREDNGEICFDYDMAIAVPFTTTSAQPAIDMWPFFQALAGKPLLVIRGGKSDLLSAEAFDKMKAAAPNASFAVVPGVGHAPELNEPEAVAAIDAFLAEVGV